MVKQDIEFYGGEDVQLVFNLTDNNNLPLVLTNCIVYLYVRKWGDFASGAVITKSTENVAQATISGSTVTVYLSSTDTTPLYGNYEYQLKVKDAANKINVASAGIMKINKTI